MEPPATRLFKLLLDQRVAAGLICVKADPSTGGEGWLRAVARAWIMFSGNLFHPRALTGASALGDPAATRRAFALVSLFYPRLSYDSWTRYLRRATRSNPTRAGVVFVEDLRGYPHALFRYAVDLDPSLPAAQSRARRVLRLTDLVVGEIAGSGLLATVASNGEDLARRLQCGAVVIELPRALLGRAGELAAYDVVAGGVICRSVELPPAALRVGTAALHTP